MLRYQAVLSIRDFICDRTPPYADVFGRDAHDAVKFMVEKHFFTVDNYKSTYGNIQINRSSCVSEARSFAK